MPEGPSIVIAKEAIAHFAGRKVLSCHGSAAIDFDRIQGESIRGFKTWGKHLLIVFPRFTVRIHLLMFGTYRINEQKHLKPKLSLQFSGGDELNFYTCAVKWIEGPVARAYDWSLDIMGKKWNAAAALKRLQDRPKEMACDVLMDQQSFSGVGNIIKNEVLFRTRIHPEAKMKNLSAARKKSLIREARIYSFEFLKWKKAETLQQHWCIYTKKKCPRCALSVVKKPTGTSKRRTFFCPNCQLK